MYSKFILVFLIVVLVSLVLFLGGYLISSKEQIATIGNLSGFDQQSQTKEKSDASLHRLSTVKAVSPTFSEDGKQIVFFESGSGKILTSDFAGQENAVISGKLVSNFSSAHWSRNGYEALIVQNVKGTSLYSYFNLKTGRTSALSSKISYPIWSPNGSKIAYLFFDSSKEAGQISISNPDGSLFKNILPTRINQLAIAWPKEDLISFYGRTGDEQSLFTLGIDGNNLEKVLGPVSKLQTLWAPDSSKLLVSYLKEGEKIISIVTLKDHTETQFNLLTDANKCTWSANAVFVYCGAKETDDQLESLYAIDVPTQSVKLLFTPFQNDPINIKNPFLSPAEDFLIFINNYDQYLYSISL